MKKIKEKKEYATKQDIEIDASSKRLGRLASEIAILLMGKDGPEFKRNVVFVRKVKIKNASKINIDTNKKEQKAYKRYSGYPSGLREEKMEELIKRKGVSEVIKIAVYGMLPKNKLRSKMIKNLVITE